MFKDRNEDKSSIQIFAEDRELDAIRDICGMVLNDTFRKPDEQRYSDFHFLTTQPDGGIEWCKKAIDYAEEHQIIFPYDAYEMGIRPVNLEVLGKVRAHRKVNRPPKK